jgi:alkanesulfonate monooxygenase SsuD/methylene tetrahydromethanopterin reductase-like flavin-dependent oxidoreductase (luciferase family)
MPGAASVRPIRLGVVTAQAPPWAEVVEQWQEIEALGFDSAWLTDHFMADDDEDGPMFEGWTALAGLAMATSRIRIGLMVTGNTYRHPSVLAKQAVTVDHISGGRLELGLGAGWWKREHEAYGFDFPGPGELVGRFAETLDLLERLQAERRTDFSGRYYSTHDTPFAPKSLQLPGLPVTIGCKGPKMLALTAAHADAWNTRGTVEMVAPRMVALDDACRLIGRDPSTLVRSVWPYQASFDSVGDMAESIAGYREVGFTEIILDWPQEPERLAVLREASRVLFPSLRPA